MGVRIRNDRESGTLHLTQQGLIDSVLRQVGLDPEASEREVKPKFVPSNGILHRDSEGADRQQKWNYRSVIGKLMYLANNTRPDLSFAVHQCARYATDPKQSHEEAVKYICRYLWLTRDKGMICTPTPDGELNAYADADFAGRWHQSTTHMRESVLSRTGYVIMYCGCPIIWASKLQTEVALSSAESELMALSACMRVILPMRRLVEEIGEHSFLSDMPLNGVKILSHRLKASKVFEDNASCIVMATSENVRPRTRHIATKYYRFKDEVRRGKVQVIKVDTKQNISDIFTKSLVKDTFEYLRFRLMGW